MSRTAGILLPITSLPSKYGIGCFSESAYKFVDWLKEAGQCYWQILPLVPTSYGDSPYQSFSTYAGNPYFISLESLIEEGVLTKKECDAVDFGVDATDAARAKINAGVMTGTIRQDAEGMAKAIIQIANNFITDEDIFNGIEEDNKIGEWRVNIPYSAYTGENAEQK